MKKNFVYISHQLARIMRTIHVAPCLCEDCAPMAQRVFGHKQLNDPMQLLIGLFPNASPQQLHTLAELAKGPRMMNQIPQSAPHLQKTFGAGYMCMPGGGKQLSQIDRRMVAEYAKVHGAVAAAKKFGVPPPVSTYYKKDGNSGNSSMPQLQKQGSVNGSPGPSNLTEKEGSHDDNHISGQNASGAAPVATSQSNEGVKSPALNGLPALPLTPNTPGAAAAMFAPAMVDMLKMNSAAHQTGSPGFLRGRGRGRPKLIGDELDADLVEYMVSVKQTDPHGHLTASQALQIAKQYILEKAPGLLEEHGGHVKLKLTWAMKLVSRIAERQKEIELGLPAGTLSNMGRHQLQNLPGGNFMADMMAQNILSQHMMFGTNGAGSGVPNLGGGTNPTATATAAQIALAQSQLAQNSMKLDEEGDDDSPPASSVNAPEIVNIKELNLPFLSSLFGDMTNQTAMMLQQNQEGEANDDENMDDE
ncbi:hypothetical protein WR25_09383 isoform B [Diploscapter pachys]|uniref:Uncharacterized protein n=1 Tax=Diploscapter pachys TaxID=2018661 RepID=A0A2A2KPS9_9BILA|nr:hypothetical protein WR25_09383 isoform A [Diploscapter pachys]PAV75942.1 hypothetical protein WR25_09383 isoform B [Diploscapter pachys]